MKTITLTKITPDTNPGGAVTFSMSWRKKSDADVPSSYVPLPPATIAADGTITDPSPYKFTVPDTSIVVKAVSACGDAFQKIYIVCEPVTNITGTIEPMCEGGYTLSVDKTYCYLIESVAATPPASGEITVEKSGIPYSTCGTYLYSSFNPGGTGVRALLAPGNPFWANGGTCADNNLTDGPMNRAGLWATTETSNQDIGFSICFTVSSSKTYYIGLGCDNYAIVKLDGETIIQQDETAIDASFSIVGSCFKVWHIYPISIPAGNHILELRGHNVTSIAALGAEIYDNTPVELAGATGYADLNLVFSTKDYIGEPLQYATGDLGYSCPDDSYYLDTCQTPYICKKTTTKTPDAGKITLSFKPETAFPGQYNIQVYNNDNLTTPTNTELISPPYPVTVTKQYTTPDYANHLAKITALACNTLAGQKQISPSSFCSPPTELDNTALTSTTASFSWDTPQYINIDSYKWELLVSSTVVLSGLTTSKSVDLTSLSAGTNYTFKVYTNCQPGVLSTPAQMSILTPL